MEGAQKFSFHRSFPRTDVTKSVDQGAQLVERERRLEGKADAKADDAGKLLGARFLPRTPRTRSARRSRSATSCALSSKERSIPPSWSDSATAP